MRIKAALTAAGIVSTAIPAVLVTVLAFRSGGFSPADTAGSAIVVLAALAVRVTATDRPFRLISGSSMMAICSLVAFGAWSLASASWSDATSRAVLEYDRVLLYAAILVLFASIGRDPTLAGRLSLFLSLAFVVVSAVALGPYLLAASFPLPDDYPRFRLAWPTSYWNTTGLFGAFALLSAAHATCSTRWHAVTRVVGAACVPIGVAVIWYSISRGALLVLGVSMVVFLVLGRSRGMLTGLPVITSSAIATCLVCASATGVTDEPIGRAGVESGKDIALLLGLVAVGTAMVRVALLALDRRIAPLSFPTVSTRVRLAGVTAVLLAAIVAFGAADGSRRVTDGWERFASDASVPGEQSPSQRFTQLGNNGRVAHYRVAWSEGFEVHPFRGTGAGTFAVLWSQHRETDQNVVDAHSLYLEVLAELGIVGLGLLLLALGTMLGALIRRAWKEGGAWALLAAVSVGWCVGSGFDWYWETPATTLWFFAAGGLALSHPKEAEDERTEKNGISRRLVLPSARICAVVGVLILAITPVAVLRSQSSLVDAIQAFREGDCTTTIRRSLDAARALNSRPEPFELLSYCDARSGRTVLAVQAARAAVSRDPASWEFRYVLGLALASDGRDPRPALREALRRNRRDPRARDAFEAFRDANPRSWRKLSLRSQTLVPGEP